MSAILAVFNRNGEPVAHGMVETMLAATPQRAADGQRSWIAGCIALGHQHFLVTPEEQGERQPLVSSDEQCALACDARLDNRAELAAELGLDGAQAKVRSDAALILAAYGRWGSACVTHLLGDFSFAVWDGQERSLFVANDALGARTVCYYLDPQRCVVASELLAILAHPAVEPRINETKVARLLINSEEDDEESYYQGILYLPPGHCLLVTERSERKWPHWQIDPQRRIRYRRDEEYAEHYLGLLREAVRCRLRSAGPVGISMSGGLDSTSIAALAAELLPQARPEQPRLRSFSYVFDELKSCDERAYIRPVAERYNLEATYLVCDDLWTLRDLARWPVSRDYVWWDAYAWLPDAAQQAAGAAGCRVLLTGQFGNELFDGGAYWAAELIRSLRWGELFRTAVRQRPAVSLRRDLVDFGLRPLIPRRLRQAYRRLRPRRVERMHPGLHPDLAARTRLGARHVEAAPAGRLGAGWLGRRYRALALGAHSQGMAATRRFCQGHGVELADPYYDRRLVEFAMAVPADQLGRPQRDQWLHRNAFASLLPDEVSERRNGTSFLPLMHRGLGEKERGAVADLLWEPLVAKLGWIRADWIEERRQSAFKRMAPGDWLPLWLCLCLELWLRRHWSDSWRDISQ